MVLGWVDTQWQFLGPLYQRNEKKKLLTDPVTSLFLLNFSTRSRATGGQLATLERNFDVMANWWFLCHEFKIANSFSWSGNFVFRNFYEFIHTNFVFVPKTSNSFVRIREGFQHILLRMACTVCVSVRWWMEEQITWNILLKIIRNPGQLKFTDLPHGILFCQERPGIMEETHKSNSFTQSILWTLFPDASFLLSKASTQQNRFFKGNQTKS